MTTLLVNYISLGSKGRQKTAPTADGADPTDPSSADSHRLQVKQHHVKYIHLPPFIIIIIIGFDQCQQEAGGRRKEAQAEAE